MVVLIQTNIDGNYSDHEQTLIMFGIRGPGIKGERDPGRPIISLRFLTLPRGCFPPFSNTKEIKTRLLYLRPFMIFNNKTLGSVGTEWGV